MLGYCHEQHRQGLWSQKVDVPVGENVLQTTHPPTELAPDSRAYPTNQYIQASKQQLELWELEEESTCCEGDGEGALKQGQGAY